jgi:hypothetical protein
MNQVNEKFRGRREMAASGLRPSEERLLIAITGHSHREKEPLKCTVF